MTLQDIYYFIRPILAVLTIISRSRSPEESNTSSRVQRPIPNSIHAQGEYVECRSIC